MEIINYLNEQCADHPHDILAGLKDELGIKYSHNERFPELYVLNYCGIYSPKHHLITLECRSLVVEFVNMGDWKVISRSFDRFFNYGETETGYNADQLVAHEKMDGSLIGLFYHGNYGWLYRTSSLLMPTNLIIGSDLTWDDLIEEALGGEWLLAASTYHHPTLYMEEGYTYILGVTSPENKVITRKMTLLNVRNNYTGAYMATDHQDELATFWDWNRPKRLSFPTMAEAVAAAKGLPELNEGYVMLSSHTNEPVCTVKGLRLGGQRSPCSYITLS